MADGSAESPGRTHSSTAIDMGDPTAILRLRQAAEYRKLCQELRVHASSAVLKVFALAAASEEPAAGGRSRATSRMARRGTVAASRALVEGTSGGSGPDERSERRGTVSAASGDGNVRASNAEVLQHYSAAVPRPHDYDFSASYLGDRQLRPLAAALAVDRQLVSVKVPGVGMFDKGMVALCEMLRWSPSLEMLDISGNRFSTVGAEACVSLAKSAKKLHCVTAKDTALDPEFCERRGLPSSLAAARLALQALLAPRAPEACGEGSEEGEDSEPESPVTPSPRGP